MFCWQLHPVLRFADLTKWENLLNHETSWSIILNYFPQLYQLQEIKKKKKSNSIGHIFPYFYLIIRIITEFGEIGVVLEEYVLTFPHDVTLFKKFFHLSSLLKCRTKWNWQQNKSELCLHRDYPVSAQQVERLYCNRRRNRN